MSHGRCGCPVFGAAHRHWDTPRGEQVMGRNSPVVEAPAVLGSVAAAALRISSGGAPALPCHDLVRLLYLHKARRSLRAPQVRVVPAAPADRYC